MWAIDDFHFAGYQLDMYPGEHFPHHFHLSCSDFDLRILYRLSNEFGEVRYSVVWRKDKRRKWKPLTAEEEKFLLNLIHLFFDELEGEWSRMHHSRRS